MKSSKTRRNTRKYGGYQPIKHKADIFSKSKSKSVRTRRNKISNLKINKSKSVVVNQNPLL